MSLTVHVISCGVMHRESEQTHCTDVAFGKNKTTRLPSELWPAYAVNINYSVVFSTFCCHMFLRRFYQVTMLAMNLGLIFSVLKGIKIVPNDFPTLPIPCATI